MYKIFKKNKFDIVQYSTPNASFYAAIASKLANVPVRLYCQWGIVYVGFKGIRRSIFNTIEKTVCKLAAEGKIPAFKVGKFWRFRKSEIDNWTEESQGK